MSSMCSCKSAIFIAFVFDPVHNLLSVDQGHIYYEGDDWNRIRLFIINSAK